MGLFIIRVLLTDFLGNKYMKTKLLKKVRKRYEITKVYSYSNVCSKNWKEFCDGIGFPFYYVKDNDDGYGCRNHGFRHFPDAIEYIRRLIRAEYTEKKTRITKAKEEKVWYK